VLGAQVTRDRAGILRLVVGWLGKSYGERAHGARRLSLHERNDQRGVDTTRQESSQRHIGDHLQADCLAQQTIQRIHRFVVAASEFLAMRTIGDCRCAPVTDWLIAVAARIYLQRRSGRQSPYSMKDGIRLGDVAIS